MNTPDLSSSLEDYLESILTLQEKHTVARVKDIADLLDVKRSSVTIALRALSERGLVNYSPYSVITLTPEGFESANAVRNRHNLLTKLFIDLFQIEPVEAEKCACRMEHGMNQSVYRKTRALVDILTEDQPLMANLHDRMNEKVANYGGGGFSDMPLLMDLNGCQPGDTAIIRKIIGTSVAKKRYMEMGLTMGQEIKLVKAAPLDDPIEVQIRSYRLSLRRKEAENILVEKI